MTRDNMGNSMAQKGSKFVVVTNTVVEEAGGDQNEARSEYLGEVLI